MSLHSSTSFDLALWSSARTWYSVLTPEPPRHWLGSKKLSTTARSGSTPYRVNLQKPPTLEAPDGIHPGCPRSTSRFLERRRSQKGGTSSSSSHCQ